jgi:hypothetical protein
LTTFFIASGETVIAISENKGTIYVVNQLGVLLPRLVY